jgi:UDP:flavonoid glycosyltransferase YjiC (YdhE family)
MRIDSVSSPFAGHLHPQLDLAMRLRASTDARIHFLSTPAARKAIELCEFEMTPLLADRDHIVAGIANAPKQVGSNPYRLWGQLRDNVSMMDQLIVELRQRWQHNRPDLAIVDFAVPVAGLLARSMGIPWWTSLTAVCAMETLDGVPTYLGGLQPRHGLGGRIRNIVGRQIIRSFKRTMHLLFRRQMLRFGIPHVYRRDGYEMIYSPETILAYRPREFEFPCSWPSALHFVGPLTQGPAFSHRPPQFVSGKPHVLVSLGTHVGWAKKSAAQTIRQVALAMPQVEFHFSHGKANSEECTDAGNYHEYAYFPYHQYAHHYAVSINHGGSGVLFTCLRNGIPILIWPQDFDQYDHAARVLYHGLGLRLQNDVSAIVRDLQRLLTDTTIQQNVNRMKQIIESYDTTQLVGKLLDRLKEQSH